MNLSAWSPKDGRDDGLRAMLQAKGFQPEDVMPADDAASVTQAAAGSALAADPVRGRRGGRPEDAAACTWRVGGTSWGRRSIGWRRPRGSCKEAFGNEIVYGPNFSPHPFFWPELALFVQAFRRGAINRATHSDYWWQVGELGPQMSGFLLDVFRAGLARPPGGDPGVRDAAQPGDDGRGLQAVRGDVDRARGEGAGLLPGDAGAGEHRELHPP